MIVALAMAASILITVAYLLSPDRFFHIANATLWPVVALSGIAVGAWPQTVMTVTFGVGGMVALIRAKGYVETRS